MRIGYCSPFNPLKSGISDFSEELVGALAEMAEVVAFSPAKIDPATLDFCEVHDLSELDDSDLRDSLDVIVYHVGNNLECHDKILDMYFKYPGVLELHDVGLHHLVAEKATREHDWDGYRAYAEYCHGERGTEIVDSFFRGESAAPWETHPIDMSMNRKVIEKASAIIVHSEFAKQMVLGVRDDMPITVIMHHSVNSQEFLDDKYKKQCRDDLGIKEDDIVFGSFGFATKPKRILEILEAVSKYKEQGKRSIKFYIVGETAKELNLVERIEEFGLEDVVKVTGYTDLRDFEKYMCACDFCLNLRYPTQGESSGSLHRMLGMGKPVIVTEIGAFADYPDDIAVKVRYDEHEREDIFRAISRLVEDDEERKRRGSQAYIYAKENCDIEVNARKYISFLDQLLKQSWQADWEDVVISKLCELGLTDERYISHFGKTICFKEKSANA